MRKKLLVILLLVVLIVLVVTRCGGKKDQQNDPADGQGFAQQSGKAELPAELKLGVVTETESGAMQLEVEQNGEKTVYVFSDITINDWYVPAVNYVVTNGLMSGTDVGGGLSLFRPNYGMTRAQLAMILYRFAGGEPVAAPRHTYGDVSSGEWYYDCVNWADTNGTSSRRSRTASAWRRTARARRCLPCCTVWRAARSPMRLWRTIPTRRRSARRT